MKSKLLLFISGLSAFSKFTSRNIFFYRYGTKATALNMINVLVYFDEDTTYKNVFIRTLQTTTETISKKFTNS